MSEAIRAAVRPMVFGRFGGPEIPLESAIERMLRAKVAGPVLIAGGPRSGRSTAVDHLRAVFAGQTGVRFLDEPTYREVVQVIDRDLLVFTGPLPTAEPAEAERAAADGAVAVRTRRDGGASMVTPYGTPVPLVDYFTLSPWGRDEWIEYVLARYPAQDQAILTRALQPENARFMGGSPLLATVVFDAFAADPAMDTAKNAIRRFLQEAAPSAARLQDIGTAGLNFMFGASPEPCLSRVREAVKDWRVIQLIHQPVVQALMATDWVMGDLNAGRAMQYLIQPFKTLLIRTIADELKENAAAYERLAELMQKNENVGWHGTMVSLLVAAGRGWKPTTAIVLNLRGAKLSGAAWSHAALAKAMLDHADLSSADLREAELNEAKLARAQLNSANLEQAQLKDAKLHGANLRGARLARAIADGAEFYEADLTDVDFEAAQLDGALLRADLTRTRFVRADLYGAVLEGATIDDTDFTGACLEKAQLSGLDLRSAELRGAELMEAVLTRCRLDDQHMPGVNLRKANLSQADLTGSCLTHADLSGAILQSAGLAEIEWEHVDLSGADLRNCSFHAGSSRSGLVDSPLASEGTRTGFYTDEYDEQLYRPIEEIRKANLRGADLRGANLEDTDFYLVDLRGAKYDAEQEAHFRRCGGILEARV